MLLEMVWDEEEISLVNNDNLVVRIERKYIERKFSAVGLPPPRKRKFKHRLRENPVVTPRAGTPIHESETDLCIILWRSVIVQALYDISGSEGNHNRRLTRAEGLAWFAANSRGDGESDFEYVCQLADLQPSRILALVREVRERGEEIIDGFNFRTIRRDYSDRISKKLPKKSGD